MAITSIHHCNNPSKGVESERKFKQETKQAHKRYMYDEKKYLVCEGVSLKRFLESATAIVSYYEISGKSKMGSRLGLHKTDSTHQPNPHPSEITHTRPNPPKSGSTMSYNIKTHSMAGRLWVTASLTRSNPPTHLNISKLILTLRLPILDKPQPLK